MPLAAQASSTLAPPRNGEHRALVLSGIYCMIDCTAFVFPPMYLIGDWQDMLHPKVQAAVLALPLCATALAHCDILVFAGHGKCWQN